jgi:hypothetical protein
MSEKEESPKQPDIEVSPEMRLLSVGPDPQRKEAVYFTDDERFGRIDHLSKWLPEVDPDNSPRWTSRFMDRDAHLLLIQGLSVFVLALNLAVTIWVVVKHGARRNISDVLGASGGHNCETVKTWNKWLHFAINALSTLLLGAGNYCSQLLVAPTRDKVDDAHRKREWLDIGVQSIRNLMRAPFQQKVVWVTLMLSSGLLHL